MSAVFAMVLVGVSLVPWLIAVFASFFLFDAPDAAENDLLGAAALMIWTYPLFAFVGIGCGLFFRKRNPSRAVALSLGIPGAAAVLAVVLTAIALG